MTAATVVCVSCGIELPPNSKCCNEYGAAVAPATTPAEYKQVTVLFADVVHSIDIAGAMGAERLHKIMAWHRGGRLRRIIGFTASSVSQTNTPGREGNSR